MRFQKKGDVKQYIARFCIRPGGAQDIVPTDWEMVALNDLGSGGVFFHDKRNLKIGTTIDLKIGFSVSMPPIECRGVVTRVHKHPNFSIFGIATEFTEIDANIKEMINKAARFVNPDNKFLYNKV